MKVAMKRLLPILCILAGVALGGVNGIAGQPPYPIIFVHGLTGSSRAWTLDPDDEHYGVVEFLQSNFNWGSRHTLHFCLNQTDGTAVFGGDELPDYPGTYHDDDVRYWSGDVAKGNIYLLNFFVNRAGEPFTTINFSGQTESHAAAIMKQGYAIGIAIGKVLEATGADKVVLVGHSMGGLAIREYLQRKWSDGAHPWWATMPGDTTPRHHVAKVVTIGTPHGGAGLANWTKIIGLPAMTHSEACRDLTTSDSDDVWLRTTGIYLFGGDEMNIDTQGLDYWFNADVTCDGWEDNQVLVGDFYQPLDDATNPRAPNASMPLPVDLEYFYVVGNANALASDGVVDANRAYLTSPSWSEMKLVNAWHVRAVTPPGRMPLLDDHQTLVEALDEPDDPLTAYGLVPQQVLDAFITAQGYERPNEDDDYFKLVLPARLNVRLSVSNFVASSGSLTLCDSPDHELVKEFVASQRAMISGLFNAGTYFVKVHGVPTANSYLHPYQLFADVQPYLQDWQILDADTPVPDGAILSPKPGRVLHVTGHVGGSFDQLQQVEVRMNGERMDAARVAEFDFALAIPDTLLGVVSIVVFVRDTTGGYRYDYRSFFITPAEDSVYLDRHPRYAAQDSYQEIPVYVDSGGKPLGALSFEVCLSPATGVVQYAGSYPLWGPYSGGLQPLDNPATYLQGTNIPVIAVNSQRPDEMRGEQVGLMLRFLVNGAPGDVCRVWLSNVVAVTTSALTNEDDGEPTRRFSVATGAGTIVVRDDPRATVSLKDMPPVFERHHIYPLRLVVDASDQLVSAMDVTLRFSTNAFRVMAVEPYSVPLALTVATNQFTNGEVRIIGMNSTSLTVPQGVFDAATIWLDVKKAAPGPTGALSLQANAIYVQPGEFMGQLYVPTVWQQTVPIGDPAPAEVELVMPPPTNVVAGTNFDTPIFARIGLWPPAMIGGRIFFPKTQVRIESTTPVGNFADGSMLIDTNRFGLGTVAFFLSQTNHGAEQTNDWQQVLTVRWLVLGSVLQAGNIAFTISAAADGVENGVNACLNTVSNNYPFQIVGPSGDLDGDGIPDWWEVAYFTNGTNAPPNADSDGDGMSNWQEYWAGTNPTNAASVLEIVEAGVQSGAGFSLRWPSVLNRRYRVTRSLSLPGAFIPTALGTNLVSTPPTNVFVDPEPASGGQLFYRVEVER
jgi:pimeloyl-ACP methyl ester carboxylesterase